MVSTSDHSFFFFFNLKNKIFLFLFLFFIILISCVLVVVPCLTFQSRKVSWFSLQNNSRCQRHKDYLSSFRFSKRRPRLPTCYLPLVVLSFSKAKKKKEILPKRHVNIFTRVSVRGQISTRGILFLVILSLFQDKFLLNFLSNKIASFKFIYFLLLIYFFLETNTHKRNKKGIFII